MSYFSFSALCLDLPVWSLEACQVLSPGPVNNKLFYFNFSFGLLLKGLTIWHPVLHLTHVNFTDS